VLAISCLCSGDGAADVVGRRFGGPPPPPPPPQGRQQEKKKEKGKKGVRRQWIGHRIPWCPQKSWAGTGGFVAAALATSYALSRLFQTLGWATLAPFGSRDLWARIVGTTLASAAAETLPVAEGWDNLLVFAAALAADRVVCRRRGLEL
jgi:dolichol kinase